MVSTHLGHLLPPAFCALTTHRSLVCTLHSISENIAVIFIFTSWLLSVLLELGGIYMYVHVYE